eukprot:SAG25_NODE_12993_length_272_cov_4.063584_1_plen_61_part_01
MGSYMYPRCAPRSGRCGCGQGVVCVRVCLGPRPALELMLNNISTLAQGMRITYEIHDDHVT